MEGVADAPQIMTLRSSKRVVSETSETPLCPARTWQKLRATLLSASPTKRVGVRPRFSCQGSYKDRASDYRKRWSRGNLRPLPLDQCRRRLSAPPPQAGGDDGRKLGDSGPFPRHDCVPGFTTGVNPPNSWSENANRLRGNHPTACAGLGPRKTTRPAIYLFQPLDPSAGPPRGKRFGAKQSEEQVGQAHR